MNRKNDAATHTIWLIVLSFLGTVSISQILAQSKELLWYTNSICSVFLFAGSLYMLNRFLPALQKTTRRNQTYAVSFAFLLSLALVLGSSLEADSYIDFGSLKMIGSILCLTLYAAPFIYAMMEKMMAVLYAPSKKWEGKILESFWKVWLTIFVLWIPSFLAFFPGAFVYDAQDEYVQVASRSFTTHHPLLHELMLGAPIRLFEHFGLHANVGIACYTIFQMVAFSFVLAYLLLFLKRRNIGLLYRFCLLLFFGLFPVYPMYAVCSAKDTLFSAALLMVIVLLLERKYAAFAFFSVFMMLMRNNGVYAYIVLMLVLLCTGIKKHKKILFVMAACVALFLSASFLLKISLQAEDTENQEMLTVPIQQLARTYQYAPEVFSEEEKEILFSYLSKEALNTYTPRISDILKSQFNNESYATDSKSFLGLWLRTGIKKPFIYLNAWFLTSYGYWYPDALNNSYGGIQRFTFQYENSSYFGFETEPPGERHSLFPVLEAWYRNISLELSFQRVPVLAMLFSPGFVFWCFLFFFFLLLREKKKEMAVCISIVPAVWLTVLLGPTTLVRYVLILWLVLPIMPGVLKVTSAHEDCKQN